MVSGVGPTEHGEATGIWIINLLTATPHQIRGNAEGAVPSPDGDLVAYKTSTVEEIGIIDSNGENARVLATAAPDEKFGQVDWSPDGKSVTVIVRRVGEDQGTIENIGLRDGKRSRIAQLNDPRSFVWLPDGRLIVAAANVDANGETVLHEFSGGGKETLIPIGTGNSVAQISATADGRRLVLVRKNDQSDAYVGALGSAESIVDPHRITLDDRDDIPTGWLKDGKTILFSSARNGTLDVFRQQIDSFNAEQMASGPGQQFGAEADSGGKTVLYWSVEEAGRSMRLMMMPSGGGPADLLMQAPLGSSFHCATNVPACFLLSPQGSGMQLSSFNPRNSALTPVKTLDISGSKTEWGVASDGSSVAFSDSTGLKVVELGTGKAWSVPAEQVPGTVSGIAPAPGSSDWIVTTTSVRENDVLLVGRSGIHTIWTSERALSSPHAAPDGKHIVFGLVSTTSNAWLIENF